MGQITTDQSHAVMAVLATNVDWTNIDFAKAEIQDAILRDPKGAGERFTDWLMNGGRIKSITPQPFNPAEFIGQDWTIWKALNYETPQTI